MPISERSFRDRQTRGELLKDTYGGFVPTFNPADPSLVTSTFTAFLTSVDAANDLVEGQESTYKTNATNRVVQVKVIKKRATQIVARLKSNTLWLGEHASAKQVADKLRGFPASRATPPPVTPTPAQVEKRARGEQANGEIAVLFDRLISIATAASGYATGVPTDISSASLTSLSTAYKAINTTLSTLDGSLSTARKKRDILYYNAKGFQEKFQSIKEAVKAQYNQDSAEYLAVKGIKW